MELDYSISKLDFSLTKMAAVKVACHMLEANAGSYRDLGASVRALNATKERVRNSGLPSSTKQLILNLAYPVHKALNLWYRTSHCHASPVWTPQGTVDFVSSAKTVLEDETAAMGRLDRFLLACESCHEESILRTCSQLSAEDEASILSCNLYLGWSSRHSFHDERVESDFLEIWSPVSRVWLEAYKGHFGKLIDGRFLSHESCYMAIMALEVAITGPMNYFNGITIKYFFDMPAQSSSRYVRLIEKFVLYYPYSMEHSFSPETICLLYSAVRQELKSVWLPKFSWLLLNALLKWPHQQRFLVAARLLMRNMGLFTYTDVLKCIAQKEAHDISDCDYKSLFRNFWQLGASYRSVWTPKEAFSAFLLRQKNSVMLVLYDAYADRYEKQWQDYDMMQNNRVLM